MKSEEHGQIEETTPQWIWDLPGQSLDLSKRSAIMGIVNVTPDSFSDGGKYLSTSKAVSHGLHLANLGANILDIGGESTRPGSASVSVEEELARVVPVIQELATQSSVPISVDTMKPEVAREALKAGAKIINDVSGFSNAKMIEIAAEFKAGVVVMHMQGTPSTMQQNPHYDDVIGELHQFFEERIDRLTQAGLKKSQIVIDPGIGFGKNVDHNVIILQQLNAFHSLGVPLCLGVSRKSMFGKLLHRPVEQRLAGSLTVVCFALSQNSAQIVRVHDVAETRDAVEIWTLLNAKTITPSSRKEP